LKELGNNADGTAIKVLKGKFGPYVSDGSTNATLPEGTEPDAVTMEQALALIAERAAKGGKKPKKAAKVKAPAKPKAEKKEKPAPKKKAAAKTTTKKKAAAKPQDKKKSKEPELAGE
jgi:DNA topoisomerase-1